MLFWRVNIFFIDSLTTSMSKVPPIMLPETHHEYFWWSCYSYCDCVVFSPSIGLTFIVHLKIISKLKAGSVLKVKVLSADVDTILIVIKKRSNTNINEVIMLTIGKPCRCYDFYGMGYFTE